jgi:transcriptional regulator GlxA family with amidase domain
MPCTRRPQTAALELWCNATPIRMPPRKHSPRRIAAVALDGFAPLDLAVAASVFAAPRRNGEALYSFLVCGAEAASVSGAYDFVTNCVRPLDALDTAEMIVVPGLTREISAEHRPVLAALRTASIRGATILGIGRGVSVLANAGVLDGRRASVDAEQACLLAERHPSVLVEIDAAIVQDGAIVTCVSPFAALDYCLQVVRSDWGAAVANELARELLGPPRLSGQVHIAESSSAESAADAFARTLDWMRANGHRPITIGTAAARAQMSKRHFMRRFVEHTGLTPMQWLLMNRVLAARHLILSSDLPLKQIAARVGFPSARALSDQFRRRTGSAPTAYRQAHRRRPL